MKTRGIEVEEFRMIHWGPAASNFYGIIEAMGIKGKYENLPPLPSNIRERLKNLREVFERNGVFLAYFFGSFLEREDAEDIDIAVLGGDYFNLLEELKEYLGTERIDLLDLLAVSPFSACHILKTGKLIYSRGKDIENNYEMKIIRECCDLDVLRRKQMELIKEEFYGV